MKSADTILVVIDDPAEALPCVARALQLAEAFNSDIELFSAVFDTYIAGERFFDSPDLNRAKQRVVEETRNLLEGIAEAMRDEGVTVRVDVAWDAPFYEGVVRKALRSRPRFVVRNNHYHHRLKRSVFSNDDWNLIRTCPVPLVIARPKRTDNERLRVCAAVDPMHDHDKPAELDDKIYLMAKSLCDRAGGDLTVLHSYDPTPLLAGMTVANYAPLVPDIDEIVQSVRAEHQEAMEAFADQHGFKVDSKMMVRGNAREVLPAHAIERAFDIVVMGAVSRGFLSRVLVGNTAEHVLDRMPCDIVIIKPDGFITPVNAQSSHKYQVDAA